MATYRYKARDTSGKAVSGRMDAVDKEALVDKLHKMGYMPTEVAPVSGTIKIGAVVERMRGISVDDMVLFNIQLSNMISSGINILMALNTLDKQIENRVLKNVLADAERNVEAGSSFSEAVAKHPAVFPKLFVNMVRAGEASGKLDTVLLRYAEFYEKQADLRQKIKGALLYPVMLLFAGIAVTLFIVTVVIPQFVEIFVKSGIGLPLPTVILYNVGMAIKNFWYLAVIVTIATCVTIRQYAKTKRGRLRLDGLKLKLPILGRINRKAAVSRFSRTLATLLSSGVPILESLDIVKNVVENEVLAGTVAEVSTAVEKGERMAGPLKVSGRFPPDAVQMIASGEESGDLETMLQKIADFYDMSLGHTIKRLATVIEPLFLAVMAAVVGFIMASMLLPIFDLMQALR